MTPEDSANHSGPPLSSRRNGWKEVASYFGRGVRTVQRWERDLGLPVHRINTGGGEVVYALVPELERWQESAAAKKAAHDSADVDRGHSIVTDVETVGLVERSPAATRTKSSRQIPIWVASGALVVIVVLATIAWVRLAHPAVARQPAAWKVADNALTILDSDGGFLWEHRFDFRLTESAYYTRAARELGRVPVVIDDLDSDGNVEVLFVAEPWQPNSQGLFCFDHRGSIRFHHVVDRVVRFGARTYGPVWRGGFVSATGKPGKPHDIWFVSLHLQEFPTVLEKLDVSGTVKGEYWSNGQIESVATAQLAGRSLVFVGAISNEFKGGSLAVLDAGQPFGAAPATGDRYRCAGCAAGTPLAFLVFPRLDVAAAIEGYSHVVRVLLDSLNQIMVEILHDVGSDVTSELQTAAISQYTLDSQFRVTGAELGQRLPAVHRLFESRGLLDHPFDSERDARSLWPVRQWNGTDFSEITGPQPRSRH